MPAWRRRDVGEPGNIPPPAEQGGMTVRAPGAEPPRHPHPSGQLILALAEAVSESVASPPPEGLRGQLKQLAKVLGAGLAGAAVAAVDEDGEVLALGLRGLVLSSQQSDLDVLTRLGKEL